MVAARRRVFVTGVFSEISRSFVRWSSVREAATWSVRSMRSPRRSARSVLHDGGRRHPHRRGPHARTELKTHAVVSLDRQGSGFTIPEIALEIEGVVPGVDESTNEQHAETAKATCPVSKALAGAGKVTLSVKFKAA